MSGVSDDDLVHIEREINRALAMATRFQAGPTKQDWLDHAAALKRCLEALRCRVR